MDLKTGKGDVSGDVFGKPRGLKIPQHNRKLVRGEKGHWSFCLLRWKAPTSGGWCWLQKSSEKLSRPS